MVEKLSLALRKLSCTFRENVAVTMSYGERRGDGKV